ncbi:MAG: type IV pilus biogenesis/stability protein PilW [Gammaproteobacteria bacterium]
MSAWQRWSIILVALGLWFGILGGCAATDIDGKSSNTKAAESNVALGVAYMRKGMNAIALEKLERALRQDPSLPSAHLYIAVLYDKLDQNELADKHYRKAVRLDPNNPRMHSNYGKYLCKQKRYRQAEKHFMAAVNDPLYEAKPLVYTNAGLCAQLAGTTEKAERYFRRALAIQPNFAPALSQMMQLSYERGEYLEVREYLKRYRSVAPVNASILWLGVQVENALGDENAAASYALRLRVDYPNTVEAKQLEEGK